MNIDATVLRAKLGLTDQDYDFYRCYKCKRLITRIEEIQIFTPGTKNYGKPCTCGSQKYHPAQFQWYHLFLPRVMKFAWYRLKGMV
jgi:hypothetical protein